MTSLTSREYTRAPRARPRLLGNEANNAAASVLDRNRKLLGYIDVAALKAKWEAGNSNPVNEPSLANEMTLY